MMTAIISPAESVVSAATYRTSQLPMVLQAAERLDFIKQEIG